MKRLITMVYFSYSLLLGQSEKNVFLLRFRLFAQNNLYPMQQKRARARYSGIQCCNNNNTGSCCCCCCRPTLPRYDVNRDANESTDVIGWSGTPTHHARSRTEVLLSFAAVARLPFGL